MNPNVKHQTLINGLVFLRPASDQPRLAIIISKKNFKTAVMRNTIKRRIREAYKKASAYAKLQQLPDLRVQAKQGAESMSVSDMAELITKQFQKNIKQNV